MGGVFKRKPDSAPVLLPTLTKRNLQAWLSTPRAQLKRELPDGRKLILECARGLESQASAVFEVVGRLPGLDHDTTVRLGPSFLRVRRSENMLFLFQPDFAHNPDDEIPDLTLTCLLLGHHVQLSLQGKFKAEDAFLLDALMLSPGGRQDDRVFLRRNQPAFEGHTGLYLMGLSELKSEPAYRPVPLALMLRERPSILMACGIANDSIAQFMGEELIEVVDGSNRRLYSCGSTGTM